MAGIDWTYFGAQGGDPIECFVATCLRKRHGDTRRVQPAQGDGGIDIERDSLDGLVVWQVKKFTAPLTSNQRTQVEASWNRFLREHVIPGKRIARYSLVTPWNPTNVARHWFNDLVANQTFEVTWEGEPFFNGLASDFPEVVALYTRGPAAFDDQLMAKSILAASPVETGPPETMLKALDDRHEALREIRDQIDPNYLINISERTSTVDGQPPRPHPDDAGAMHRYTYLGDNRWSIATVVPRSPDSGVVDPIDLGVRFIVEPGSPEEHAVREFELWGVPFDNVEAETWTTGGPFAAPEPTPGFLSFGARPVPSDVPGAVLSVESANGNTKTELSMEIVEITRGMRGGGLRFIARSQTGAVEVEIRTASDIADKSIEIRFPSTPGKMPASVRRELEWIEDLAVGDIADLSIDGYGAGMRMGDLRAPNGAMLALRVARALATLAPHTTELLPMPDVRAVTPHQLERAEYLARIYSGQPFESRWDRLTLTVEEYQPELAETIRNQPALLAHREQPELRLGEREYLITREMVTQFLTPRLTEAATTRQFDVGDEFELVPGQDNRMIAAVIIDSEP